MCATSKRESDHRRQIHSFFSEKVAPDRGERLVRPVVDDEVDKKIVSSVMDDGVQLCKVLDYDGYSAARRR